MHCSYRRLVLSFTDISSVLAINSIKAAQHAGPSDAPSSHEPKHQKEAFKDERRITLNKVPEVTGIARATLNRIANVHGYNTTTDSLDALCKCFGCTPCELLDFVADSGKAKLSQRPKQRQAAA